MIREAIDKLIELGNGTVHKTAFGKAFRTPELVEIPTPMPGPNPLEIHTLDGLVSYVKEMGEDQKSTDLVVHIQSPTEVFVRSKLYGEFRQRECLVECTPFPVDTKQRPGSWLKPDAFIVYLQTAFVRTEEIEDLIRIVGNLESGSSVAVGDDGVTQTVATRKGVALKGSETIPSPVTLQPYRTFPEVTQPASSFVIRIAYREDELPDLVLLEVVDGSWRPEAVANIRDKIRHRLPDGVVILD